jgi:iron(III) transport system ATP-binding protein
VSQLIIESLKVSYGKRLVLHDISLTLDQGSIAYVLGPSGCGKTTLLRAVAGFEKAAAGSIRIAGKEVAGARHVPPEERGVGMVFQDYGLFPHLTALHNTAFGLSKLPKKERRERAKALLEQVGLADSADKYPHELSGGQQQRVALVRALAPEPRLLLMDEPFSNLDEALRERLAREVTELLKRLNTTAIIVTHNREEALATADALGEMEDGRLINWSAPENDRRHSAHEEEKM